MAFDVANCLTDIWFRLGFSNAADMTAATSWLTSSELFQWADDAVKALARTTAVFMTYDTSVSVIAGTATYNLPARHIFTESAWLIYSPAVQLLRLSGAQELFALDATWPATSGPPTRLSLDAGDVKTCVLYPSPIAGATLALVIERYPPDIVSGASTVPCASVLQDAASYAILAGALSKESDNSRVEVAAHCMERLKQYADIARQLWGPA
jgi:hypothetical protein